MASYPEKTFDWSHISLACLLRTLWRNLWMILAAGAVMYLAVTLALEWLYVPQYRASMTYAVNSRTTSYSSSGNLTSTKEVAGILTDFLETDILTDAVRSYDPRLEGYDGAITATQLDQTNFIQVQALASTPEQAFLALDAVSVVFPQVADFISNRNVLNVLRAPTVSSVPANQLDSSRLGLLAALLGAALMAVLLVYMSIQQETIQTRTGARHLLDAPILASVGHEYKNRTVKTRLRRSNRQVRVFSPTTSFDYIEQIGAVCSQLEHEAQARERKVFMIAGVGESEGKSTVCANVAATLALKGYNVALVDCDLRKPSMNDFFDGAYSSDLPLNKMLARPYSREDLLRCMVRHEQLGLYMLFPLDPDGRSTELISSPTMDSLIAQLRVFDYVILDTPPIGMFPDAEVLADKADASLLVVRQDYTMACDINDAIDTLRRYRASFLGCVLNDMRGASPGQYGYGVYGAHSRRYGYGESKKKEG